MNKVEKSLRWMVNQIPDFKPTTNKEKMLVAIKLYSEAGAKEINRLEAENAALRERLDKAVELPCKLGDTIYEVYDKCDGHNCPYNGYYGQWRCHYEGEKRCKPFIKIKQFCYSDIPFVNDTVFVSREAAEARLAELKGETK